MTTTIIRNDEMKWHYHQTDVSELSLRTNLFDFGSMISSVMLKWGRVETRHKSETQSFCLNWKTVPSSMPRDRRTSQTNDQL